MQHTLGPIVALAASVSVFATPQHGTHETEGLFLTAQVDRPTLGLLEMRGCWGYTSPSGREYALACGIQNSAVVEVTDPFAPEVIAVVPGTYDVKVFGPLAYFGGNSLTIVDLANVDNGVVTVVGSVPNGALGHLAIDETSGFLYTGGSISIYDLNADPTNPPLAGAWGNGVSDLQVVTYTSGPHAGRQIAFVCDSASNVLRLLDVTDKQNVLLLATLAYPGAQNCNQGWLSEDRRYFYLSDQSPPHRTYVFNVVDVDAPFYVTRFTNNEPGTSHNLYVTGDLIFEANLASGLRVFDASDPEAPVETAFSDVVPWADTGEIGVISCYPFFQSGTVIGTARSRGLFVWKVSAELLTVSLSGGVPPVLDPGGAMVSVTIQEGAPGDLASGSERLLYDVGTGFVETPLIDLGGGGYEAVFPALPCGTSVSWYVEARVVSGLPFRSPASAPQVPHESLALDASNVPIELDMEAGAGWTVGFAGDDATAGIWERVDPIGTYAQPEDDHSPDPGTHCWVTGQGVAGGAIGANDVDGGRTSLVSPVLDLSGYLNPSLGYWRWYSNGLGGGPSSDVFEVLLTDDGQSWQAVEVVGPGGPETEGGWIYHSFRLEDIPGAQATDSVQLRFVASDEAGSSLVEAAVDDLRVFESFCGIGSPYCSVTENSRGLRGLLIATGSAVAAENNVTLEASDLPFNQFGYFLASRAQGFAPFPGGSVGNLCLANPIARFAQQVQSSGPTGTMGAVIDLTSIPMTPPVGVAAGDTWHFQGWHRDVVVTPTSNFTNGTSVTFR